MYLPSCEKRTSEMEEMISEKKDREDGSSSCSNSRGLLVEDSGDRKGQSKWVTLTFCMLVTERTFTHIGQFDRSLRAGIHEPIATLWVEFGGSDDFGQFFHICRFNVNDVEGLVLDVEIPQIDPEIVAADESFTVAVDRDAVDVIRMSICISSSRNSGDDCIMMGHPR